MTERQLEWMPCIIIFIIAVWVWFLTYKAIKKRNIRQARTCKDYEEVEK